MLPNAGTLKTTAIAAIAAFGLTASLAVPAQAFGDRERAFVQGVATAVIVDRLIDQGQRAPQRQQYYAPQPQYYAPQPQYHAPQQDYRYREPTHPRQVYTAPRATIYSTPAARAFSEYSASTRRAIQIELADYGYYRGGIDGQWGPGTSRAVDLYARDQGRTGLLDSRDGAVRLYNGLLR